MKSPYENQLIGAFLYAIGYEGGRRNASPMPVNLFQQTPLDRSFGDLVIGADTCFILEFKRSAKAFDSEIDKWTRESLKQFAQDQLMREVSGRAHFIVYAASNDEVVDQRVCYYSDVLYLGERELDRGSADKLIRVLYETLESTERSLGVSPKRLETYLKRLSSLKKVASDGGSAVEGAWLAVARHQGRYLYLTASSLAQLLERSQDLGREKEREHARGIEWGR